MTNTEKNIRIAHQRIIIAVLVGMCCVMGYIILKPSGQTQPDNDQQEEIDRLKKQNKELEVEMRTYIERSIQYSEIIDSLQSIKPKIKIKYEKIYEGVDTLDNDGIVNEFSGIFSKEGIE